MSTVSDNNKRIAKNTFVLYLRQIIILATSLFTSRVVLKALGVEDYGINNVVAGAVTMFSVVTGFMSAATSRYLNFAMGKEDNVLLRKTFSVSFSIYVILSLLIVLLCETIGLWFVNNKLVIPADRMIAANWIFQFAILSCVNTLLATPYNAAIISHERMNVYAYVSIFEAILKLLIVYVLYLFDFDKLILYGFLLLCSSLIVQMVYRIYCVSHFQECKLFLCRDKMMYKEMLSYSLWNLLGTITSLAKGQGLNILLNMFFNPSVNAARGISYQINTAITNFSNNFYSAVRPQVTKYYAKGELDNMFKLVFRSSRMTYYLILFLSLPIVVEAPFIINLWLGLLPENVVIFTQLIIAISAVDGIAHPLMTTAQATGNIKVYQASISIITILNLPLSYIALKMGASPVIVFVISLCTATSCIFVRLFCIRRLIPTFPVLQYINKVLGNVIFVTILAAIVPIAMCLLLREGLLVNILICIVCIITTSLSVYFVGMTVNERTTVASAVLNKIRKKK